MDIDAIKSRLNQLQNTTTNSFWKPQPGKTQIRIVPYFHNKSNPFSELYFHYSLVKNKTVLSPLSFGRPDPVQEFADKLKASGNKDEWIQGKRIEPKMRTFAPVIVRGEENEGVKAEGADALKNLLDNQPNLTELYNEPSYDELKQHLGQFLNPNAETSTEESEPEMVTTEKSSNVEDDFDKLFNS
jgi:hypothetical protein